MNRRKKIIFSIALAVLLFLASGFMAHNSIVSWRWDRAVSAAGALPFQVGLTSAIIIPCFTTGMPPTCEGGTLCSTIMDIGRCPLHSDVTGMSAGGSGQPPLLLSNVAVGMSGLTMGGQLIYGGTTNSMYLSTGNTVLASAGGCYGCTAKAGKVEKIMAWLEKLDKYIIAGIRKK